MRVLAHNSKAFSKFYHKHSELIVKCNIRLKTLLQRGISEMEFYGNFSLYLWYGDLVCKFKRIFRKPNLRDQCKKIIKHYKRKLDITLISCNSLHAWL